VQKWEHRRTAYGDMMWSVPQSGHPEVPRLKTSAYEWNRVTVYRRVFHPFLEDVSFWGLVRKLPSFLENCSVVLGLGFRIVGVGCFGARVSDCWYWCWFGLP
jgi:hypothetical protein